MEVDEDNEDNEYYKSCQQIRSTMWCCLSCGMPFTFPEQESRFWSKKAREFVGISRDLRVSLADIERGYYQWNPVHVEVQASTEKVTESYETKVINKKKSDFLEMMGEVFSVSKKNIDWDEKILLDNMKKKIWLCVGCKELMREIVPEKYLTLPSNWNLMGVKPKSVIDFIHNTIRRLDAFVEAEKDLTNEIRSWKIVCLKRLYLGFFIHCMAVSVSATNDPEVQSKVQSIPDFEIWYMFTFVPLRDWELGAKNSEHMRKIENFPYSIALDQGGVGVIEKGIQLCRDYPFILNNKDGGGGREYREFTLSDEMTNWIRDTRIPSWAPACVVYGLRGQAILERIRLTTLGFFKTKRDAMDRLHAYTFCSLDEAMMDI